MRTRTAEKVAAALAALALAACGGDERAQAPPAPPASAEAPAQAAPAPGPAVPAPGPGSGEPRADTASAGGRAPVLRLPSGDSVELVGVGPARVAGGPPGLLVTYHPFFSPDQDTTRTRGVADELWRANVRPGLKEPLPPFVVLQATSRRAGPIRGAFNEASFGVVLERRGDGKWYRLGTSQPVE